MQTPFRIAYLVNRYPAVSHSFVRREILALESLGVAVRRLSIRTSDKALPDPRDRAERDRTTVILTSGVLGLLTDMILVGLARPFRVFSAFRIALAGVPLSLRELVRRCAYVAEACTIVRLFRSDPVDHLHAHFGTNPAMVARLVHHLGGPPFSFTAHGPDEFDRPVEFGLRSKIADAGLAVGVSSFGRSQLMRWSDPCDWSRIAVVRCGVDESFLDPDAPRPVPDAPRLCCVARLSAQKGLPLLIDAAAELKRRKIAFRLTLVGDGEMRAEIEKAIAANDLRDEISITGWQSADDVREHLLDARAMVLPSFAEGLPVVIMEALALKRPVIATAIAGTPELVDNMCGWLIPAGSTEALVGAMIDALSLPIDRLEALGAEGRRRVLARHDSAANAKHLLKLIWQSHETTQ